MDPINVYALVAPAVVALILVEFAYCLVKKNGYYSFQDSVMGLGTMFLAQCVNVLVSVGVVVAYGWIFQNFAMADFSMNPQWYHWVLCYLLSDFLFYWFHRAGHRINLFWAMHVPHHSAEELNYAVALRASLTQRAASFLFYWPMAIIGFSPEMIIPVVALNLVYQLIPHTRVIGKLPSWIDSWLNTPYHHRIHHAANQVYWDKNLGGTLIIWDKLFGTYQDEVEPVFYGVTVHPHSWDPLFLNFHWFMVLWNDMKQATHWEDKILLWFKPPGWRPRNLPPYEKQPWRNPQEQVKYESKEFLGVRGYLIFQLVEHFLLLQLIIRNDSPLTSEMKVFLSLLVWWGVTNWAFFLESKPMAWASEMLRTITVAIVLMALAFQFTEIVFLVAVLAFAFFFQAAWIKKIKAYQQPIPARL